MATWQEMVEHYTSSIDLDDIPVLDNIIREGIIKAIDRVQIDLLLKYCDVPDAVSSAGVNIEESRILYVERDRQPCVQKSLAQLHQINNTDSIHYATKYSPVFIVKPISDNGSPEEMVATLKIYPAPVEADSEDIDGEPGLLYSIAYPTSGAELKADDVKNTNFIPSNLVPIITLYIAEKVLAAKLALMVHEEEDGELGSVIQNQLSTIRAFIAEEEPRLGIGQLNAQATQGGMS